MQNITFLIGMVYWMTQNNLSFGDISLFCYIYSNVEIFSDIN